MDQNKYIPGGEYWNAVTEMMGRNGFEGIHFSKNRQRMQHCRMLSYIGIANSLRKGMDVVFVASVSTSVTSVFNACETISTLMQTPCYFEPVIKKERGIAGSLPIFKPRTKDFIIKAYK